MGSKVTTEALVEFLVQGLSSAVQEVRIVCEDALHSWGEDILPFLTSAVRKQPSSTRQQVINAIRRITTSSPDCDVSVQDAVLACLATDNGSFQPSIDSVMRHLPDFVDDVLSLAVDVRAEPDRCIRVLQAASCSTDSPGSDGLRQLEKLASRSRYPRVRAKASKLLARFSTC